MTQKDFDAWCRRKQTIDALPDERIVYFGDRDIWWCALGLNIGYEQDGKNAHYERPVLIVRKVSRHLALVVPLTTKIKDHPFYVPYRYGDMDYAAIVLQSRVISSKRLLRKVGNFSQQEFAKIVTEVAKFVSGRT